MTRQIQKIIGCLLFISFFFIPVFSHATQNQPHSFTFDEFLMASLPGGYFFTTFLENYSPKTTCLLEESNGFAYIDHPRIYHEGNSFLQFNWFYQQYKINSLLHPGAPLFKVPFTMLAGFAMRDYSPKESQSGLAFLPRIEIGAPRIQVSTVYGQWGDYVGWTHDLIFNPSSERDDLLVANRRRLNSQFHLDFSSCRETVGGVHHFGGQYFAMNRLFNDFTTSDQTFSEPSQQLHLLHHYHKKEQSGLYEVINAFGITRRNHLQAELAAYSDDTAKNHALSLWNALSFRLSDICLKASLGLEHENLSPFNENPRKQMADHDGDSFFPMIQLGRFTALGIDLNLTLLQPWTVIPKVTLEPFLDINGQYYQAAETVPNQSRIFFLESPYQVVNWQANRTYHHNLFIFSSGFYAHFALNSVFQSSLKCWANYQLAGFSQTDTNINFLSPGIDFSCYFFKDKKTNILLSLAHIPLNIKKNLLDFLETNRPSGAIYFWNDDNSNEIVDPMEQGNLFGFSGGPYHSRDQSLKNPSINQLLIHFQTPVSQRLTFQARGMLNQVKHSFGVRFPETYGFYETVNDQNLYFFDRPFDCYTLTNPNYKQDPFYGQFQFDISGGTPDKWFFSFSFMAHIGMGATAFGNGANANDIGIIHENMANPNTWINEFGRLDGDRAFVGKICFVFHLLKNLTLGSSLKYRDGTPFAFIEAVQRYNQWALYYQTIKAEDERGVKGGPREDFLSDISIKLNYRLPIGQHQLDLALSCFNLLDTGNELSEYVFSGGSRDAMERQLPRSLRFTVTWEF
jgi:hypothetical protein